MRALDLMIDARNARMALERLTLGRPFDGTLSRAIDRCLILEEQAAELIRKIAAARRRSA